MDVGEVDRGDQIFEAFLAVAADELEQRHVGMHWTRERKSSAVTTATANSLSLWAPEGGLQSRG